MAPSAPSRDRWGKVRSMRAQPKAAAGSASLGSVSPSLARREVVDGNAALRDRVAHELAVRRARFLAVAARVDRLDERRRTGDAVTALRGRLLLLHARE